MKKCIVIGSGIAGIACAIRLNAIGYKVTVFESNPYPGGKLSECIMGDFRFDAGPSFFTMPGFVEELFALCNEKTSDHFKYVRLKTACHYFYDDGTLLECPNDKEALAGLMEQKFGENKKSILDYFKKSQFIYNITFPVFLEKSLHRLSSYLRPAAWRGMLNFLRLDMFRSMHKANVSRFRNPKTVQFFDRFATYNGSSPFLAPATLNVIPHLEFEYGLYFPSEGMHAITRSLYQLAVRHGVEFKLSQKVEKIHCENGRITGVLTETGSYGADIVVSNMDVYPTYKKLLPEIPAPKKIELIEPSCSALIFYWCINREFKEMGLHNVFFSKDYRKEFEEIYEKKIPANDPTIYINISSKLNNKDAPQGCENWFVMINSPYNNGQDWDTLIQSAKENILNKLSFVLKTDIRSCVTDEMIMDPRMIELKTSSHRGALYGSSSNRRMSAFFRHSNFSSKLNGLFFCGGSVHPGGGIPLCLLSAKIVSGLIKDDLG